MGLLDLRVASDPADPAVRIRLPGWPGLEHGIPLGSDDPEVRIMLGPDAPGVIDLEVVLESGAVVTLPAPVDARPAHPVPSWAFGRVWYQIFPERYRNGNPANDPSTPGLYPMPWNAAWHEATPHELETGWANGAANRFSIDPEQTGGVVYNLVWHRRYGGDLQGIVETLPHLRELGVDGIYVTPIFQASSMHKYDAADFRHIDASFGAPGPVPPVYDPTDNQTGDPATWTWTEADRYFVEEFLPAARAAGMRVMVDVSWNHTGRDFWAFDHIVRHGSDSPYRTWFEVTFHDDGSLHEWNAWDRRNGYLPRFRRVANGDLNPEVKAHIFAVTRRWMDPNGDGDPSDGVDGWRLDVAPEIAMPFWRDWRSLVKSINPECLLVGEVWYDARAYFGGEAFDAQMNYPFAIPVTRWLGTEPGYTAAQLAEELERVFTHDPANELAQMNLLDSHDTARIASMLWNPGRGGYDANAQPHTPGGAGYRLGRPPAEVYERALVGLAIQATYLGAPMLYYGSEWGMHGADDPDNRMPLPWPDLGPYDNPDEGPQPWVLERTRAWLTLRHDPALAPTLRLGRVRPIATGDPGVFAFERQLNQTRLLVVANRSDRAWVGAGALLEDLGGAGADDRTPSAEGASGPEQVGPRSTRVWVWEVGAAR